MSNGDTVCPRWLREHSNSSSAPCNRDAWLRLVIRASDEISGESSADTYCAHRFHEARTPHSRCRRSRSIVWAYVCRRSWSPHGFPNLFTRLDAPRDAAHMPSTLDRPSIANPVLTTVAGVAMVLETNHWSYLSVALRRPSARVLSSHSSMALQRSCRRALGCDTAARATNT